VHTIIVIATGLVILGLCLFIGLGLGGGTSMGRAALLFLPLWFLGAGINMYIGVRGAGYAISEEVPVFLLVFSIPAVFALLFWWKFTHH
jgi:hypothetical protein